MATTPHRDWATEKVRTLSPASKEKSTLLAIARYADSQGNSCYPSIATIARGSGHSIRTTQRHIKTLIERGELYVEIMGKKGLRTNTYAISVCRLTKEERESITGISITQMELRLREKPAVSEITIENPISEETQQIFQEQMNLLEKKLLIKDAPVRIGTRLRESFQIEK